MGALDDLKKWNPEVVRRPRSGNDGMSASAFLAIYKDIANNRASDDQVERAFTMLKKNVEGTQFENQFAIAKSRVDQALAIDAVAAAIHRTPSYAQTIFGSCDIGYITKELNTLSGMEDESDVRRESRGFFSTIKSDDDFEML